MSRINLKHCMPKSDCFEPMANRPEISFKFIGILVTLRTDDRAPPLIIIRQGNPFMSSHIRVVLWDRHLVRRAAVW